MLVPRKIERPRLQDLNSNTFEFNSNGFELRLGKRKVHKCSDFLVELRKMMKEYMARFEEQLEAEKA